MTVKGITPKWIICFDGQSMWNRPAATNGSTAPPAKIMAGRPCMWASVALDGTGWTILANTVTTRRDPYAKYAARSALLLWGGQGNINADQSGADTYTAMAAYAATAVTAGFDIIVGMTMLPYGTLTGPQEIERLDYNSRVLADASNAFDYTIDVNAGDGLTYLQNPANTTYYETDTIHLKSAGTDVIKTLVDPTVDTILALP